MATKWCPTCCESCNDHPLMCTICGDSLTTAPPSTTPSGNSSRTTNTSNSNAINNAHLLAAVMQNGIDIQLPIDAGNNMNTNTNNPNNNIIGDRGTGAEWQTVPADILDPQATNTTTSTKKGTSQDYLAKIPRIRLEEFSAILHEAVVEITTKCLSSSTTTTTHKFSAMISEFQPHPPFQVSGPLILSHSIHGRSIPSPPPSPSSNTDSSSIFFMKRGGSITFVQKANYAASLGASAVICANNIDVWPYIMKDSKGEAASTTYATKRIPIVMVKQSDGQIISSLLQKSTPQVKIIANRLKGEDHSCVICREEFKVGDVLMRIPICNHAFHEDCATLWLSAHNTCPFCRRELPAESHDEGGDMDIERRRRNVDSSSNNEAGIRRMEDDIFG